MEKWPIYLVGISGQEKLARTFVRFQEHYESPRFQGKVFTLADFLSWYEERFHSNYFKDWEGFNIPSWVLCRFWRGEFNPLSEEESRFIKSFTNIPGKFYIIGADSAKGISLGVLRHEFAHGLFYINEEYRQKVNRCIHDSKAQPMFYNILGKMDYDHLVWNDEMNAYLLTELTELGLRLFFSLKARALSNELRKIFLEHFDFELHKTDAETICSQIHLVKL